MLSIRCTVTLNHEEIGKNSQRISKIKHFISKYNWRGIITHQKTLTVKSLRKII